MPADLEFRQKSMIDASRRRLKMLLAFFMPALANNTVEGQAHDQSCRILTGIAHCPSNSKIADIDWNHSLFFEFENRKF
jgi:hypothetical protein